ncbi:vWA domain-containing protein [Kaistia terrae]|uniref:VWA domain-containing protein n=1 Tax=Kaistia terrae TaxID=537017 RepID=A0ABW0PSJ7_9HYPH|nr:VWA domain-containing protein [Kaistia terrae]MCX5578385.1 VWA domain-containing protein [Kaistia terrae]
MSESHQGDGGLSSGGRLDENLVQFGRLLRRAGMPVGPAAILDAIRAVEIVGLLSRDDFYWTLHAVLVTKREQRAVFDEAFRLFWKGGRLSAPIFVDRPRVPASPKNVPPAAARVAQAMYGDRTPESEQPSDEAERDLRLAASVKERLATRDFAQMSAEELAEAQAALARLTFPDDRIPTRRLVTASRGKIDARRTLRAGLRTGGDMILPVYRKRAEILPPIVALCDISGSMSQYSRILLHFLHALGATRRVDTFLFGTRLTNVSRELRLRDPDAALAACAHAVEDWSGGTRIATALHDFNRLWSRRVLGQGAIVLLVTDGLERDSLDGLTAEMDRLHRACRRLIWLNPLLRFDGFEAKARGIRAMLPHVDEFRAVHSLGAVADLVRALGSVSASTADPRRYLAVA